MAAQAAYSKKVKIASNALPFTSASLKRGGEVLDSTEGSGTITTKARIIGIRDWSIDCSGPYDHSNAALAAAEAAWIAGGDLAMSYLPNGTNGFAGNAKVSSFETSGDVSGLETFSVTFEANGALGAYT